MSTALTNRPTIAAHVPTPPSSYLAPGHSGPPPEGMTETQLGAARLAAQVLGQETVGSAIAEVQRHGIDDFSSAIGGQAAQAHIPSLAHHLEQRMRAARNMALAGIPSTQISEATGHLPWQVLSPEEYFRYRAVQEADAERERQKAVPGERWRAYAEAKAAAKAAGLPWDVSSWDGQSAPAQAPG